MISSLAQLCPFRADSMTPPLEDMAHPRYHNRSEDAAIVRAAAPVPTYDPPDTRPLEVKRYRSESGESTGFH
jgi:hypothetical protein